MDWADYADSWPNAEASHFVQARPHRWHVQTMGPKEAPTLLLLHGTGGATHSWRDLAPLLSRDFRVIAPDLPGHGFTRRGALQRSGLDAMTQDLGQLMDRLGQTPKVIVGHSAGAALALAMAARAASPPDAVVALNPAVENFEGPAGWLFPMMAKALSLNPLVAPTFARLATDNAVRRLIEGTGSRLDPLGLAIYRACLSDPDHVEGALAMMAQWSLDRLRAELSQIHTPTLLLTGANDKAVPPEGARRTADLLPNAEAEILDGLGHLAHEEAPEQIAERVRKFVHKAEDL